MLFLTKLSVALALLPQTEITVRLVEPIPFEQSIWQGFVHRIEVSTENGVDTIPGIFTMAAPERQEDGRLLGLSCYGPRVKSAFLYDPQSHTTEMIGLDSRLTDFSSDYSMPAVSEDGRMIAYTAITDTSVRATLAMWPSGNILGSHSIPLSIVSSPMKNDATWVGSSVYQIYIGLSDGRQLRVGHYPREQISVDTLAQSRDLDLWVAPSPDDFDGMSEISRLGKHLAALDATNPASVAEGLDYIYQHFTQPVEDVIADSLYAIFSEFHKVVHSYVDKEFNELSNSRWGAFGRSSEGLDSAFFALRSAAEEAGFMTESMEGQTYLIVDSHFISSALNSYITPTMREYLRMLSREENQRMYDDGIVVVVRSEIARRLSEWDSFGIEHPDFIRKNNVELYFRSYLMTFLSDELFCGSGLRYGECEEGDVWTDVRESFEDYVSSYGATRSGVVVSEFLRVLEENGFSANWQLVRQFMQQHNLRMN